MREESEMGVLGDEALEVYLHLRPVLANEDPPREPVNGDVLRYAGVFDDNEGTYIFMSNHEASGWARDPNSGILAKIERSGKEREYLSTYSKTSEFNSHTMKFVRHSPVPLPDSILEDMQVGESTHECNKSEYGECSSNDYHHYILRTTSVITGILAERVLSKWDLPEGTPVFLTEEDMECGYSEWTGEMVYSFTLEAGHHRKDFGERDGLTGDVNNGIVELVAWLESPTES